MTMKINIKDVSSFRIVTPCDYRAEIYRCYLEEMVRAIKGVDIPDPLLSDSTDHFPSDSKIKLALHDRGLLESLARILDKWVMYGVIKDLEIWRKRECIEEKKDAEGIRAVNFFIPPDDIAELDDSIPDRYAKNPRKGYSDYFNWYIAKKNTTITVSQNDEEMSGVEAFYRRYPLIKHAVKKSAENFRDNISLACNRIIDDWENIGNVFFSDNWPYKLTKIKCSGSDTHKGGKQVLFLTFQLSQGSQHRQLVYKPSDVEMDYRLVGRTNGVRGNYDLDDSESLTELVNNYPGSTLMLPTYRILPRSLGSSLQQETDEDGTRILPVYNSYGYIEFLSHKPEASKNGLPNVGFWSLKNPLGEWVTDKPEKIEKFYHQLGGFMAIISVFSLCDFHHENILVHNLQPYLIDLENCFAKPIKGFDSVLGNGLNSYDVLDRDAPINKNEGTVTLDLPGIWEKKATQNRICFQTKKGAFQLAKPAEYPEQIFDGFNIVLGDLSELRGDIQDWLDKTKMCVARSVILPTKEYYEKIDLIYVSNPGADPDDRESFFSLEQFRNFFEKKRNEYNGTEGAAPIYALQNRENDFRDFLNCDIPAYYHRLDSKDLLNSRGKKVDQFGGVDDAPTNYFPQSTWDIVSSQLQDLGTREKYIGRIDECTKQINQWVSTGIPPVVI